MDGLTGIIAQLEKQKTAIERALTVLREVEGIGPAAPAPRPSAPAKRKPGNKRSLAQKARWAAKKTAEAVPIGVPTKAPRKGGMTPEGRQRLAEAMKRRWAAKRTAAQAKKNTRKKAA
jgi:hypothetical protein